MATQLDELIVSFKVQNQQLQTGLRQAESRIDKFSNNAQKAFAAIGVAYAGMLAVRGFTDVITTFEKLEASLRTVTGSADKASNAFSALQNFAATTPFQLEEVVGAFIKLQALGLKPSEEALISYGNTAIAMGKSLNQFIEAVADAATGEFERLKEFGIRAKSQGDNVTFIFQGMETTVRKSANEIEGYLRQIGLNQFGDAMSQQAGTLNIAMSNLEDSVNQLIKQMGDAGLTDILIIATETMRELVIYTQAVVRGWHAMSLMVAELGANISGLTSMLFGFDEAARISFATAEELEQKYKDLFAVGSFESPEQEGGTTEETSGPGDKMLEQLEKFRESLMSEMELEQLNYEERLLQLDEFLENKLISQREYDELMEDEQRRHEEAMFDITKRGNDERAKFDQKSNMEKAKDVFGTLDDITAGVSQHNRGLFELNKATGIANALISAYEGISLTLSKYPFPLNVAMAAAHGAAAFAQINAIRSTQFQGGGGGAAPSLSGSTAAAPVNDVSGSSGGQSSNTLQVSIAGVDPNQNFTGSQVQDLISVLNDAIDDGAVLGGINVS